MGCTSSHALLRGQKQDPDLESQAAGSPGHTLMPGGGRTRKVCPEPGYSPSSASQVHPSLQSWNAVTISTTAPCTTEYRGLSKPSVLQNTNSGTRAAERRIQGERAVASEMAPTDQNDNEAASLGQLLPSNSSRRVFFSESFSILGDAAENSVSSASEFIQNAQYIAEDDCRNGSVTSPKDTIARVLSYSSSNNSSFNRGMVPRRGILKPSSLREEFAIDGSHSKLNAGGRLLSPSTSLGKDAQDDNSEGTPGTAQSRQEERAKKSDQEEEEKGDEEEERHISESLQCDKLLSAIACKMSIVTYSKLDTTSRQLLGTFQGASGNLDPPLLKSVLRNRTITKLVPSAGGAVTQHGPSITGNLQLNTKPGLLGPVSEGWARSQMNEEKGENQTGKSWADPRPLLPSLRGRPQVAKPLSQGSSSFSPRKNTSSQLLAVNGGRSHCSLSGKEVFDNKGGLKMLVRGCSSSLHTELGFNPERPKVVFTKFRSLRDQQAWENLTLRPKWKTDVGFSEEDRGGRDEGIGEIGSRPSLPGTLIHEENSLL